MAYIINDNCLTCGLCQSKCPTAAIVSDRFNVKIDPDKCVECGVCASICRLGGITVPGVVEPVKEPHDTIKLDCDLCVIGGGGAGLVTAARAAEAGKRVIVLEKAKYAGGCAYYASGWHIVGSKMNEEAGMEDNRPQLVRSAAEKTHYALDTKLIGRCVYALGPFFDWLCEKEGFKENFVLSETPFGGRSISYAPAAARMPDGRVKPGHYIAGKLVMETLIAELEALKVPVLTETKATEMVTENGRVVGVKAEDAGGKLEISCKAALLATGNWISNDELCERYIPNFHHNRPPQKSPHMVPEATGDGIALAEQAGGWCDYDHFAARIFGPHIMPASAGIEQFASRPEAMYINLNGQRWMNENKSEMEGGLALQQQPGCCGYSIFDQGIMDEMEDRIRTGKGGGDPMLARFGIAPDAQEKIAKALEDETLPHKKRDTIAQLAEAIGAPAEALEATIKRYNELCEKGFDEDYFKPSEYLVPFSKGPYYAVFGGAVSDGAFGGVKVNYRAEALNSSGEAVPGLYAAGDNCTGWLVNLAGDKQSIINDLTWAFASGWMAAESILETI